MARTSSRFHYGWFILVLAVMVVFGSLGLARFGYSVILPDMQKGLSMDNTQAGLLATANLIGYLLLSAIGGAMASQIGPRVVIAVGLLIAGVGMVLTGFANEFWTAGVLRTLTGMGSGASNVPVMGLLVAWFSAKRRGLAAGVAVMGSSFGLIFVGPMVPFISSGYGEAGWRVSWFVFGAVVLVLSLCSFLFLKNRPSEVNLEPVGGKNHETDTEPEKKKRLWKDVYRSASVWYLGLIYAAFGFSYIIYLTFFTKHLITQGGYSPVAAGNLFMMIGWLSLLCGVIWGGVSDVIGRKKTLIIVYLIHTVSFTMFGLWPDTPGFIISSILFGLSAWSIPAIMAAFCGDIMGARLAPATLGFITLLFGIGQALGPGVAGVLADSTGSFVPAFLLAGGVSLAGAVASLLYRPAE